MRGHRLVEHRQTVRRRPPLRELGVRGDEEVEGLADLRHWTANAGLGGRSKSIFNQEEAGGEKLDDLKGVREVENAQGKQVEDMFSLHT